MIYVIGPGHGGPGIVANAYLEGTYSEVYPNISEDEAGMKRLFTQFSFPGGIPSHVAPETPGSIHEGGELGYSISHAYGAVFDNPDLIAACVIGDGEAETGPLATSWHSNKFLNPVSDGAVLPILHLNGYKIANPTVLARIPHGELENLMRGYGYRPHFVEGDDPATMHELMAATLDTVIGEIRSIKAKAQHAAGERPRRGGVVHQGGERSESLDGRAYGAHHVVLVADVGRHEDRGAAGPGDLGLQRLAGGHGAARQDQLRPLVREDGGDRAPDASRRARDERDLAVQSHSASLPFRERERDWTPRVGAS